MFCVNCRYSQLMDLNLERNMTQTWFFVIKNVNSYITENLKYCMSRLHGWHLINSRGFLCHTVSVLMVNPHTRAHTCHCEASTITLSVCPSAAVQPAVTRPGPDWAPSDLIKSSLMELVRHCALMDSYTLPLTVPQKPVCMTDMIKTDWVFF